MNVTAVVVDIVVIPCERRFIIVVILRYIAGAAEHADIITVVIVVGMES